MPKKNALHPDFAKKLVAMWIDLGYVAKDQSESEILRLTTEGAKPELAEEWRKRLKEWQSQKD